MRHDPLCNISFRQLNLKTKTPDNHKILFLEKLEVVIVYLVEGRHHAMLTFPLAVHMNHMGPLQFWSPVLCSVACVSVTESGVCVLWLLFGVFSEEMTVEEKILSYNRANRAVAILCNHQRAAPKTFEKSMQLLQEKVSTGSVVQWLIGPGHLLRRRHLVNVSEVSDGVGLWCVVWLLVFFSRPVSFFSVWLIVTSWIRRSCWRIHFWHF